METKKCPFCAEEIKAEAIKCKYCGSMLDDAKENQKDNKSSVSHAQTVKEVKAETKPKRKPVVSATFAIFLFLIVGAVGCFFLYNHIESEKHKKLIEQYDSEYKKDALESLRKLEELNAHIETGMNFANYSEEVGRLNYSIKTFEEKFKDQPEAHYVSYSSLSAARDCFIAAKELWNDSINSEYGSYAKKMEMQLKWSIASEFIKIAKESIPEEGREKTADGSKSERFIELVNLKHGVDPNKSQESPADQVSSTPIPTLTPDQLSSPSPLSKTPKPRPISQVKEKPSSLVYSPYTLMGIMTSSGSKVAMLKHYDGRTFEVKTGEKLPEDWIVSAISDKIVILKNHEGKQILKIE